VAGHGPSVRLGRGELRTEPGLLVFRLDAPLLFLSAKLAALHAELAGRGVGLWLVKVRALVHERLRHSGLAATVGEARLYRDPAEVDAAPHLRAALGS
jgi:hypothetical protein